MGIYDRRRRKITYRFNNNSLYVRTESGSDGKSEDGIKGYYTVTDNKVVMFTSEGADPLEREIKKFDGSTMTWFDPVYGNMEFQFVGGS